MASVLSFLFCFYFWILRIRHRLGFLGGDDVCGLRTKPSSCGVDTGGGLATDPTWSVTQQRGFWANTWNKWSWKFLSSTSANHMKEVDCNVVILLQKAALNCSSESSASNVFYFWTQSKRWETVMPYCPPILFLIWFLFFLIVWWTASEVFSAPVYHVSVLPKFFHLLFMLFPLYGLFAFKRCLEKYYYKDKGKGSDCLTT